MQILTKKRFCFRDGADGVVTTAGGGAIEVVPDWVAKTPLFNLAAADGDIMELSTKQRKVSKAKSPEDID